VGDLAEIVAHRRDREPVPEGAAVPPVVQDLDDALALLGDGGADLGDGCRIGAGALQEPAVPAERLGRRIARDALEPLVDVDQGPIGQPGIGDGDTLGGDVEGPVLQRELIRQSSFLKACGASDRAGSPRLRRGALAAGPLQKPTRTPAQRRSESQATAGPARTGQTAPIATAVIWMQRFAVMRTPTSSPPGPPRRSAGAPPFPVAAHRLILSVRRCCSILHRATDNELSWWRHAPDPDAMSYARDARRRSPTEGGCMSAFVPITQVVVAVAIFNVWLA
jgi:hypothetical protein